MVLYFENISVGSKHNTIISRHIVSFMHHNFNYILRKTMKRSNFDVINAAPRDVLLFTKRISVNTSPFVKRLLFFLNCCFAIISDEEIMVFKN